MEIREATVEDADAIERVATETWRRDYPDVLNRENVAESAREWYGSEEMAVEIRRPGSPVLVAVDGGDVVGFAHGHVAGEAGTLLRLYVSPDRRGEGVGRELLDAAVEHLWSAGVDRVDATVLAANEAGRSFYEAAGFELVDTDGWTSIGGERYDEVTYRLTR